MFDPNSETNYSPGEGSYSPQGQNFNYDGSQPPSANIKKYLPVVIGLIVLIIASFLILTWLGSQKEFTIAIVDTDGTAIAGNLTLKDNDGKLMDITPKGKAKTFKAKLFPGTYTATVTAESYNTLENESIEILSTDKASETKKLTLTRNLKATLTVALDITKIYESQVIGGKLNIVNSGNAFDLADVIATATTPLEVTIVPSGRTTLESGGSTILDFDVKIKEGTNLTKIVPTSVTFKIKGSKISSQKIDIQAMPTVNPNDLTMTGLVQTVQSLTAGVQKQYILKFKNNNRLISIENLKVEIIPDTGFEDTLNWIKIANSESSTTTTIPIIEVGKEQSIILYVKAPITAKKDEEFRGKVNVTSYSLKAEKDFLNSFKVTTETKVDLLFKMTPQIFNIACSKTNPEKPCTGIAKLSNGEAHFENKGTVAIENIQLSVDLDATETTSNCPSYLRLWSTDLIKRIEPGESSEAIVIEIMDAPASPDTVTAEVCVLRWEYTDPLDPTTKIQDETNVEINKKTT